MSLPPNWSNDFLEKLRVLAELRSNGSLTDNDFLALKARLFQAENVLERQGSVAIAHEQPTAFEIDHVDPPDQYQLRGMLGVTLLISINIFVFFLMFVKNPSFEWAGKYLLSWGADYGSLTLNGEYWRLFTSTFVHVNMIHLAGNMSCLFYWGRSTERELGSPVFLFAYCLCGVVASLSSVVTNPEVVGAGASGGIAGVFGLMCVMWLRGDNRVTAEDILGNLAVNVVLGLMPGVDWVAHVGGMFCGLVLGGLLIQPFSKS